jgi:putative addiction module component (TIGR02574 family)
MPIDLEQLTQEALSLPPDAKVALIELLLRSLDNDEIDGAWINEAERRYEELQTGKVNGIPADNVFKQLRQELKRRS